MFRPQFTTGAEFATVANAASASANVLFMIWQCWRGSYFSSILIFSLVSKASDHMVEVASRVVVADAGIEAAYLTAVLRRIPCAETLTEVEALLPWKHTPH